MIGRSLLPLLIEKGHPVTAMSRTADGAGLIESLGATLVRCDVYDQEGLKQVVAAANRPQEDRRVACR